MLKLSRNYPRQAPMSARCARLSRADIGPKEPEHNVRSIRHLGKRGLDWDRTVKLQPYQVCMPQYLGATTEVRLED